MAPYDPEGTDGLMEEMLPADCLSIQEIGTAGAWTRVRACPPLPPPCACALAPPVPPSPVGGPRHVASPAPDRGPLAYAYVHGAQSQKHSNNAITNLY